MEDLLKDIENKKYTKFREKYSIKLKDAYKEKENIVKKYVYHEIASGRKPSCGKEIDI